MTKKKKIDYSSSLLNAFIFFILGAFILFIFLSINSLIKANIISFRDTGKEVEFRKDHIEILNNQYVNTELEKAFCLGGISTEEKIIINKIDEIITEEKGTTHSLDLIGECPNIKDEELIGVLHFHPDEFFNLKKCKFSSQDLYIWGLLSNTQQIKPNNLEVFAIQCGKDKLFITDSNIEKKSLRWI